MKWIESPLTQISADGRWKICIHDHSRRSRWISLHDTKTGRVREFSTIREAKDCVKEIEFLNSPVPAEKCARAGCNETGEIEHFNGRLYCMKHANLD